MYAHIVCARAYAFIAANFTHKKMKNTHAFKTDPFIWRYFVKYILYCIFLETSMLFTTFLFSVISRHYATVSQVYLALPTEKLDTILCLVHTSCNAYEILDQKEIEVGCWWHRPEQGIQATGSPSWRIPKCSQARWDMCNLSSWVWPENLQSKVPRNLNWFFSTKTESINCLYRR